MGQLLDFFQYNVNDTAFFPALAVSADPKFYHLNDQVRFRTLASFQQADAPAVEIAINSNVNIRAAKNTEVRDLPEGLENRGLPNFNHLIDTSSVTDSFRSKL